jgi:predicted MFS family arabinose efflux permease
LGVPASLIAARLADRYNIVEIVRTTAWMMAGAAICYVLIAFHPETALLLLVGLIFFAGWGAYQAMDWALALKVLPRSESAGKDMGIWHIALVLPQILGPAATGWIITGTKIAVSARFAYTVAFGIAAVWFILSAALIGRVRLARTG